MYGKFFYIFWMLHFTVYTTIFSSFIYIKGENFPTITDKIGIVFILLLFYILVWIVSLVLSPAPRKFRIMCVEKYGKRKYRVQRDLLFGYGWIGLGDLNGRGIGYSNFGWALPGFFNSPEEAKEFMEYYKELNKIGQNPNTKVSIVDTEAGKLRSIDI